MGVKWIPFKFTSSAKCQKLVLKCYFENSHDADRLGIWIAMEDIVSYESEHYDESLKISKSCSQNQPIVDLSSWKFGQESSIEIEIPNEETDITGYVLIRPTFIGSSERKFVLSFDEYETVLGVNKIKETSSLRTLNIKKGNEKPDSNDTIRAITNLGGYNYPGKEAIVHPKQAITIDALNNILHEKTGSFTRLKLPEKELSVAYIGADTLENLTGLMRWFDQPSNEDLFKDMSVYYTHDWDRRSLRKRMATDENIKRLFEDDRIKPVQMDRTSISEANPVNIIITTYVCPWIQEEGSEEFKELVDKLLDKDSILISVDPVSSETIVRSPIYAPAEVNPQDYFLNEEKHLGLMPQLSTKSGTAQAVIYSRKPNWTRCE